MFNPRAHEHHEWTLADFTADIGELGIDERIAAIADQVAFQDTETARYYHDRANKPVSSLLSTPLDRSWLFLRGAPGEHIERFDVASHQLHAEALFWAEGNRAAASQDEGPHRNIPMRPLSSKSDVADYLRVAR